MPTSSSSLISTGYATGPPRTAPDDSPDHLGPGRPAARSDAGGGDRTARRAAAHLKLTAMARLEAGEPRHRELRRQVIAEYMPYAGYVASRYDAGGSPGC